VDWLQLGALEAQTEKRQVTVTKVRFGFKSSNQLYLFMVWREYHHKGEVVYAEVLFSSFDWIGL
jgi:hypothetical protein